MLFKLKICYLLKNKIFKSTTAGTCRWQWPTSQPVNQIQHHLNNFMVLLLLTKSSHPHLVMTDDGWLFGYHTTPTPTKSFLCGRERILNFENVISNCYNPVFKRLLPPKHIFSASPFNSKLFIIKFDLANCHCHPWWLHSLLCLITLPLFLSFSLIWC